MGKLRLIYNFIVKETVLTVAWVLAIISMFFVRPSLSYIHYIDFKSLGILWSLMVIMAGLQSISFFDKCGVKLLKKARNSHQLTLILVFLCFFSSMFITNDVALITFVPFAIFMLESCGREDLFVPVITFQTLAANLGSMMTPIGNPQNLYLYGLSGMGISEFVALMLPYTGITFVLLLVCSFMIKDRKAPLANGIKIKRKRLPRNIFYAYCVLFLLALLVVARILPYYLLVAGVLVTVFIMQRPILLQIDYALLLTFVGFFIFTGNLSKMPAISSWLTHLVEGHEVISGVISSQLISNVPAALLLSEFTTDFKSLIIGVNLGGLGTLIASMASLISFKSLAHTHNSYKGKYFLYFTLMNVIFLVILLGSWVYIG